MAEDMAEDMAEHMTPARRRPDGGMARNARADFRNERALRRRSGPLSGERVGDYQLGELLGIGGMAEVYRAEDLVLRREVAVKVLAAHLADDSDYADRFRAEARRVGALSHPHLVPVYQAGEAEIHHRHLLYLVMPLLRESLRDLRRRKEKLPATEAVWLVLQVADGLETAHRHGIVHRDIKPGNVLLDAEGNTLLADFGIARELCDTTHGVAPTQSGLILGTPEYMAPEQLLGEPVDQRADVYGLGAVLYELLTGQLPFVGATPYDLAAHALSAPLIPPSLIEPHIPPALERVVLTALSRNPVGRYSSAGMFALALRSAFSSPYETPGMLDQAEQSPSPLSGWDDDASPATLPPGALQNGALRARQQRPMWPRVLLVSALALVLAGSDSFLATVQRGTGSMTSAGASGMLERASVMARDHTPVVVKQVTPQTGLTSLGNAPGQKPKHKSHHHPKHKSKHHHSHGDSQGNQGSQDD